MSNLYSRYKTVKSSSLFDFMVNREMTHEDPFHKNTTKNSVYDPYPAGTALRTILFVFETAPKIYDKKKFGEEASTGYVPGSVLPTTIAEYFKNIFDISVSYHLFDFLDKDIAAVTRLGGVKPNRLPDKISLRKLLTKTKFVFTAFADTYINQDSNYAYHEKFENSVTRFEKTITHYKPDIVVMLGVNVFEIVVHPELSDKTFSSTMSNTTVKTGSLLGRLLHCKLFEHSCYVVPTIDIQKAAYGVKATHYSYLGGVQARLLASVLLGADVYSLSALPTISVAGNLGYSTLFDAKKHKAILVDTYAKFSALLQKLKEQPYIAIDTETANLNRVKNKLLTIQFAYNSRVGYVIPFQHFETPFDKNDLDRMKDELRNFFEGDNKNKYHIYTNAQFDLTVLRNSLGVRFFYNKLWDIFAGEYSIDENFKVLNTTLKYWYYSLLNIATFYGCDIYHQTEFGKEHRTTIETAPLNQALLTYCALDVTVPLAIHLCQKEIAKRLDYPEYESIVTDQIGDMLQNFSCMEYTGIEVDVDYLFMLKGKDSAISKEIMKQESEILATKAAQKANDILIKNSGVPSRGLFGGKAKPQLLSLRKKEHLDLLFFDALNLQQKDVGKSGKKKIDSAFQKKYSDVPEVKMFTELSQAKKLSSAYVNQMLKFWDTIEDFRGDRRIRANYSFVAVITGRISASKPNLQQIPSRSVLGKTIKRLFVASKGRLFIKADFCLTGSTLIATSEGLVRLDSLCKNRTVGSTETLQGISVLGAKGKAPAASCTYTGFKSTLRITAKSGNSISCTGNHKILVLRDGRLQWVEAENCILGDYLCVPSQQMVRETKLKLSLSDPIELNRNNSTGYTNVCKDKNTYFVKIKNGESYDIIRGRFKTAEDAAKARDNYYVSHGISGNRSKVELLRPLEMSPDLAYILGCIVSDGYITTHEKHNHLFFYNTDTAFLDRFIQCLFNVFGYQASRSCIGLKGDTKNHNGATFTHTKDFWSVRVRSNQIVTWLVELGVYSQHGRKNGKTQSHYQHVPWSILQADKKSQMAFLAAYLEADGGIRNSTHNICWHSTSYKVICGLRAILNSHGFITSLTGVQCNTKSLHLGRDDSQLFWKEIEPFMVSKKLDAYVGGRTSRLGKLPSKYVTYWKSKGIDMLKVQKKGYFFTPIIDIRDNGKHHVYDLTVDAEHSPSFTANGIIVHNCAHEVRNWGIVSKDEKVAETFQHGYDLRKDYRSKPNADLAKKIEYEGDVHKLNASFFFGVKVEDVTKELRNAVKGVIFGLIYGMAATKMSGLIKRTMEETQKIIKQFEERFPVGFKWFKTTHDLAKKACYVASPLGRRRNLFGYLVPESSPESNSIHASMNRRAVNSIVQGFASDQAMIGARIIEKLKFKRLKHTGYLPDIKVCNMVHDSVEVETSYEDFMLGLRYVDYALTGGVRRVVEKRGNFGFNVDLEIDFELGCNLRDMKGWDRSLSSLKKILVESLEIQKNELHHDVDVDKTLKLIFSKRKSDGPDWLKTQVDDRFV